MIVNSVIHKQPSQHQPPLILPESFIWELFEDFSSWKTNKDLLINQDKKQFSLFECLTSLLNQISMAKFIKDAEWNHILNECVLFQSDKTPKLQ